MRDPNFEQRAIIERRPPASFVAIIDGSGSDKESSASRKDNHDIMGVVSRVEGLGYTAHPSGAAIRTMLTRRLTAARPPADDITLADLKGLRIVVNSLHKYIATDSPANVVFVASGATPIGFALLQKVF